MKTLYSKEEFENAKLNTNLPLECYNCSNIFYVNKGKINQSLKPNSKVKNKYCSSKCGRACQINKKDPNKFIKTNCVNCNKEITKQVSSSKRHKNTFCSHSCSTSHFNKNKTNGNKRSKLEIWIEDKLTNLYPDLEIHFNKKDTIQSELDIYIPSLKLAFELNGIFHYEPIYGSDKFNKIQSNDGRKFQACINAGISLCIIDTSGQKYFKPNTSKKYLDIILEIIQNYK
jgi:hypothetical protein